MPPRMTYYSSRNVRTSLMKAKQSAKCRLRSDTSAQGSQQRIICALCPRPPGTSLLVLPVQFVFSAPIMSGFSDHTLHLEMCTYSLTSEACASWESRAHSSLSCNSRWDLKEHFRF
eukprot:6748033-Pyramimonas_sp.AAC.2